MITKIQFQDKIHQIEPKLFAFALKLTKNQEDAKDLLQETLCKAYEKLHTYTEGTNFKGWMSTILYNSFVNMYRKKKNRKRVLKPVDDFLYATESKVMNENVYNIIMLKEIKGMVRKLSDTCRVPFKMFIEGFHYQEIADELEIPIGTVKSRINFARKRLKDSVRSHYHADIRRA